MIGKAGGGRWEGRRIKRARRQSLSVLLSMCTARWLIVLADGMGGRGMQAGGLSLNHCKRHAARGGRINAG